ncbi:transcriptional repressor [Brevibacillus sp. SYP-B805]|uniref:Fur family transcriptional regulator n=1 Tax=Brevibacillus sp. SYP-B805 TaxID=1578199 RepID=UPI0013ED189F|nr:Fur family transcriptional regulator [Brevibacillus sp. SYP-B805]NGQ96585.1 transcriptional repressor [Brevibacillus sp. SYP-B805]
MDDALLEQATVKLREAGVRMTPQRRVILEYLYQQRNHPTADDIHREIGAKYPEFRALSVTTIYNNLKTLKKYGLIKEIYTQAGIARYDSNIDHHHHLLCTVCGSIADYYYPLRFPVDELRIDSDFTVEDIYVELRGICRLCKTQPELQAVSQPDQKVT